MNRCVGLYQEKITGLCLYGFAIKSAYMAADGLTAVFSWVYVWDFVQEKQDILFDIIISILF